MWRNCRVGPTRRGNVGHVQISAPVNGASVSSPVPFVATATPPDPIYTVRVHVDGFAILYSPKATVNQMLWIPNGQHRVEVVAEDVAGYIATASMPLNVTGQEPGALSIQDSPNWVSCSAVLASGSTCAAGLGVATSSPVLDQLSPPLDGSAAKFSLGGNHPYSNELYWTPLGGATMLVTSLTACGSTRQRERTAVAGI
jgi:hypothetical protein